MAEDTHVLEQLPEFALGNLDEPEARLVSGHIAACVFCRTELAKYQAVADQLAWLTPGAAPPAGMWSRLQERIQRESPKPAAPQRWTFPRRLIPVGGLVLALLALLAVSNFLLWQRLETMQVLSGPNGMRAITLQSTDPVSSASAFIIIGADGMNGVLVVDEMPQLDASHEYQLWLTRDGQNTSAAVFSVDETGYRGLRVQAPESLFNYSSARVTVEPVGGSASPTGKDVFLGSLFNP